MIQCPRCYDQNRVFEPFCKVCGHELPVKGETGIEMIAVERMEQIKLHGFDDVHDSKPFNENGELAQAAVFLISSTDFASWPGDSMWVGYPESWCEKYRDKFSQKSKRERLVIAGALIAAEIDRLNAQ